MDIAIIVFPGTNREKDMQAAFQGVTGHTPRMVWHKETELGNPDLIVLPGGFSYGDYLRCGAMAAHSPVMKDVIARANKGTRIFGVCNGFQMLVETRLLPGALLRNNSLKFICKRVHLRAETDQSFLSKLDKGSVIQVPVAHGDGNYVVGAEDLVRLKDNDQIAFRYCTADGQISESANPNGSTDNIAGVFNDSKTILGMMPHPENATLLQHANNNGSALIEGILSVISG